MDKKTDLSLSKTQVESILSALWIYEQTGEGLNDEELRRFGYIKNAALHEEIYEKLRNSGWDC